MKKRGRWFVPTVLILLTVAWILSCGGGDDDSPNGPTPPSGPTNTIDAATVDDIMQQVNDMGIGCTTDGGASRVASTINTLEALIKETANKIKGDYRARQADGVSAASVDDSIVIPSDCPGSTGEMRIDITYDDETFAFSGTLAFTDFCIVVDEIGEEVAVTGGATFSGQLGYNSSDELNSITLNASTTSPIVATASDFSASVAVTGLSFSFSEQPDGSGTISLCWTSLDVDITDGADSESIDTDNVCINVSASSAGAITITVSATITTADGSLVISTPTPITLDSGGNITGGVLQIDGANNTAVQITYTGSGYAFNVQADTDGDGEYDDYDEEMDCTELGNDIGDMF